MDIISEGDYVILYSYDPRLLAWLRGVAFRPFFGEVGVLVGAFEMEGGGLHPLVFHQLP